MQSDQDSISTTSGSERTNPNVTTTTVITRRVEPGAPKALSPDSVSTPKHEEWTTCRRVINHKTRQIETRVQRQLVYEDGKMIADSGPQITTKTTEDSRTEESENTEKTETHQIMKEKKEENMQLHNETFHELTGSEFHQRALMTPDSALFIITDDIENNQSYPGKLVHYTCSSNKVTDKEEVKEVSELKDGELTTETTRTHHHEEQEDDEVPEDETDEAALPEISKETTKNIEYYKDDGEFESLCEKMQRERDKNIIRETFPGGRDPVTWKTVDVDEEEMNRNSETTRWLENHFGSESGSDVAKPTRTKAGGNVIKIQMTSSPRLVSWDKPRLEHQEERPYNKNLDGVKESQFIPQRIAEVRSSRSSPLLRPTSPSSWRESSKSPTSPATPLKQTSVIQTREVVSKIPPKTYYLGNDGTYKRHYKGHELLKKQSAGWKSTPSIRDDVYQSLKNEEEHKVHQQRAYRPRDQSPEGSVQRSHSQKKDNKIFKACDSSKTSRETCFRGEDVSVSQTLPRCTKLIEDGQCNRIYNTPEVQTQRKNQKKSDLCVQVDLSDEENRPSTFPRKPFPSPVRGSRRRSPSPIYTSFNQNAKTLPRPSGKTSSSKASKPSTRTSGHKVSSSKPPAQTFYFGDENDVGYQTSKKKQGGENRQVNSYGTNHRYSNQSPFIQNDFSYESEYSPSYHEGLYAIEKDSSATQRRPNFHRSMGDLRQSLVQDFDHHTRQVSKQDSKKNLPRTGRANEAYSQRLESLDNHSETYAKDRYMNQKYSQYQNINCSHINASITSQKNHSGPEVERHGFLRNHLDSSELDLTSFSDESSGYRESSSNRRQRRTRDVPPLLPKKLSSLSSTPPSSPIPRLIKISQLGNYDASSTPSPPDSPSVSLNNSALLPPNESLFRNSSTAKMRSDSKSSGYSSRVSSQTPTVFPLSSFSALSSPLEMKTMSNRNQAKWSKQDTDDFPVWSKR
ncbi:uncharacterized protein LOC106469387 [Limulus polyphemus]|uniref:Uncharacterized protein LOC106469387 n=1 Tax=Limulus polyphemus TaxID=6850 RepID=A0ABM1BN40_LIMPO|nr:uncharacterized protein LOC106469387 [Limulus polyphemus]